VIGANNLFDLYPTANLKTTITSRASGVDSSGNVVYSPTTTLHNTIDQSTGNQFAIRDVPLNLDKTEGSLCSFEL
jgi:iron complex outermembrane receptor protein